MKEKEESKKRRGKGEGSIWTYKDGRTGMAVYVELPDGSSTRVQASGKTEEKASINLKKKLKEMGCVIQNEPTVEVDSFSTVAEAIKEFKVNYLVKRLRPKELEFGEYRSKKHLSSPTYMNCIWALGVLEEHMGSLVVSELKEADMTAFYYSIKDRLSNESMRKVYVYANKMFARLEKKEIIRRNPHTVIDGEFILPNSSIPKRKVEALTDEEIERVLEKSKEDKYLYPVVYFALHTGMRAEELCAVKWGTVLQNGVVQVRHAISKEYIIDDSGNKVGNSKSVHGRTKSQPSSRDLEVSNDVIAVLKEWKEFIENKQGITLGENDFIFRPERFGGDHWKYSALHSRLHVRMDNGLGKGHGVNWHRFRHTCATILGEAGAGLFELMQFLGDNQEVSVRQYVSKTNVVTAHNKTIISTRIAKIMNPNKIEKKEEEE